MTLTFAAPARLFQYLVHSLLLIYCVLWLVGLETHNPSLSIIGFFAYVASIYSISRIGKKRIIDFEFEVGKIEKLLIRINFKPNIGAGFIYVNRQYFLIDGQIAQWTPGKKRTFTFGVGETEKHQIALRSRGFRLASWARELSVDVSVDGRSLDLSEVSLKS